MLEGNYLLTVDSCQIVSCGHEVRELTINLVGGEDVDADRKDDDDWAGNGER